MKTLVLTVPHSGTHFLLKYLVGVLGLDGRSDAPNTVAESNVDFAHAHPNSTTKIQEGVFDTLIITLRHPYKSTQTGKLRGASTAQLVDHWGAMLSEVEKYQKVLFVTIDGPEENRLPQLQAIADHFGRGHLTAAIAEYASDWKPENQSLSEDDKEAIQFAVEVYEKWQ